MNLFKKKTANPYHFLMGIHCLVMLHFLNSYNLILLHGHFQHVSREDFIRVSQIVQCH